MTASERPRRRGIWIAVAGLTAITAIVPAGVQTGSHLLRRTESIPAVVSYGHAITTLEVEAGTGSVTVSAGPPGQVAVGRTLRWTLSKPHVEQSWNGGTLVLKEVCGPPKDLLSGECGVDLHVRVPAGVTVRATSTSGDITAQRLTGAVHLQSRSGSVNVAGTLGPVWARSRSGAINGTDLSSTQVDARASSGAVGLGFADTPQQVKAAADSGSVTIALPRGFRYRVNGTSASGNVQIDATLLDGGSSRRIDVTTVSGSARVRYSPS